MVVRTSNRAGQRSTAAGGSLGAKPPAAAAPEGADFTVGVEALLLAGNDAAFRDFVADLFAAASGMQAVRRALGKSTGLTGAEIAMLLALRRLSGSTGGAGSVGVRALAEHLHVAGPHVTSEVGKLVEAGLVEKRVDPSDNRAVDIQLTGEGRRALRRLTPKVRAANDVLFAGMSQAEMIHVSRFLARIVATSAAAVAAVEG